MEKKIVEQIQNCSKVLEFQFLWLLKGEVNLLQLDYNDPML